MDNLESLVAMIEKSWESKTLQELRIESEREATGMVYESIRAGNGPRVVICLCITDMDKIAKFTTGGDESAEDWDTVTLADMVKRSVLANGYAVQLMKDEYGRCVALFMIACRPETVKRIEVVFGLQS